MTVDLSTRYLGLELRSPLVASASPLTGEVDSARAIVAAGAGAIVMPSLFEEEVLHEEVSLTNALEAGSGHFAEALDYFPDVGDYATARDRYLTNIGKLQAAVDVPVIASLNATRAGSWVTYAESLVDAGADAIELNLYHVAADATLDAAAVEARDLALVRAVRAAVPVPLAVKLSPFYSSVAHFAGAVAEAGADGLVLFNRFYQPDLDLDDLVVRPRVQLSDPSELRLPLRWIAILRPLLQGRASMAATTGIWRGTDAVKALLVGADVAMTTSALLRHGPGHLQVIEDELVGWLEANDYRSVGQACGAVSYATADDPSAFERANYVATLRSWTAPHGLTDASPTGGLRDDR